MVLKPLRKYPKISQFEVVDTGEVSGYRYEIRANGKLKDVDVPFAFYCFPKDILRPFLVMLNDSSESILGMSMLTMHTQFGYDVRMCGADLESFKACVLEAANQYITNPESFKPQPSEDTEEDYFLDNYPVVRNSKIIDIGSFGSYRYEIHTECKDPQDYDHLLYVFQAQMPDPFFVIAAKRIGKKFILHQYTTSGKEVLSTSFMVEDIEQFSAVALKKAKKFLEIDEDSDSSASIMPSIEESDLVETGNIGNFRCELHTDCYVDSAIKYIHVFFFYLGDGVEPQLAFTLEKHPKSPRPVMVLLMENKRMEFGFDEELLDTKVFRDRSIALAKLALSREHLEHHDVSLSRIRELLHIDQLYMMTGTLMFLFFMVWSITFYFNMDSLPYFVGDLVAGSRWLLLFFCMGFHLRLLNSISKTKMLNLLRTGLLVVPLFYVEQLSFYSILLFLWVAFFSFRHALLKIRSYGIAAGWTGLSYKTSKMLQARVN